VVHRGDAVPIVAFGPVLDTAFDDDAALLTCPGAHVIGNERSFADAIDTHGSATATADVLVGAFPSGPSAGFTSSLVAWGSPLVVAGLVEDDVTIANDFARTYIPGHHNFSQAYLVDFAVDDSIPAGTRAQLEDADISAALFLDHDDGLVLIGIDGTPRIAP
jgi:hypothetical protein